MRRPQQPCLDITLALVRQFLRQFIELPRPFSVSALN
jgi:hypothetical protein